MGLMPDRSKYNPDPKYLRELIKRAGLSGNSAAAAIGVHRRTMRFWLSGTHKIPYHAQFTLECLAGRKRQPEKP
jgi:hypothetical protein